MRILTGLSFALLTLTACTHQNSQIDSGFLGGVALSTSNSTLQLSSNKVPAGGSVSVVLTIKDSSGNNFYVNGSSPTVVMSLIGGTSLGSFGPVTNNHDGTYSSNFTGLTAGSASQITATIDGLSLSAVATIQVTGASNQSFEMNLPFDAGTDASYILSSSSIELVGGVCRLVASDNTDNDNSSAHFGATGVGLKGVIWDSNLNSIRLSTSTNTASLDSSWAPHWDKVVGHWKMDDPAGSATLIDDSDLALNAGTIYGSVTMGGVGQVGTSAAFDGSSYVLLKDGTIVGTQSTGSISLWVSSNNSSLSGEEAIYDESGPGGTDFRIRRKNNGIAFDSFGSTWDNLTSPDLTWGSGVWHHVVGTWTGNSRLLYVDSVLVDSDTSAGATQLHRLKVGSVATGKVTISTEALMRRPSGVRWRSHQMK